jgi:8-oxo-dGTP diphosphatase
MYEYGYVPPILTTDSIIFQLEGKQLAVLLIQRQREPFKDWWALPGGYIAAGETTLDAMSRVAHTKAGVEVDDLKFIEQLYTFDTVARDPRGHAVTVAYMGVGLEISPMASDTTQNPRFFPVHDLPRLAYDHESVINHALERLKSKLEYTNACFALLPKSFTLSQLQAAYEAVLNKPLDKRNFRKKFLSLNLIDATGETYREGAHRPAQLYSFKHSTLQQLTNSFD